MPKFAIRVRATNNGSASVKVHVGASLIGQKNTTEFYNTSDDITTVVNPGKNEFSRYLNTELGQPQKYDLYVVLWEGEKPIGKGKRYASVKVTDAVEKKKKKVVKLDLSVLSFYPSSFTGK